MYEYYTVKQNQFLQLICVLGKESVVRIVRFPYSETKILFFFIAKTAIFRKIAVGENKQK